jgi:hypothetical protein
MPLDTTQAALAQHLAIATDLVRARVGDGVDFRTGLRVPAELRGKLYSAHDLLEPAFSDIDAAFKRACRGRTG